MENRTLRTKMMAIMLAAALALVSGCQADVPVSEEQVPAAPPQENVAEPEVEEESTPSEPEVAPPEKVEIVEQVEADYERWLAATMIFGLSLEYPDFELLDMYAASAVALEEKMDSQGVYIRFLSGGEELAVVSKPLEKERSEAGTRDLSCVTMGFASFDEVPVEGLKTEDMIPLALEDLEEPMSQLVLVSVYNH